MTASSPVHVHQLSPTRFVAEAEGLPVSVEGATEDEARQHLAMALAIGDAYRGRLS